MLDGSSEVFRKMLSGKFKEGAEDNGVLNLDDEVDTLWTLLHYFYHFEYDDSLATDDRKTSFAVRMYAIADFYKVEHLQDLAVQELKSLLDVVGDQDHADFVNAMILIEQCTSPNDPTLWNAVVPGLRTHMKTLLERLDFQHFILHHPHVNFRLLSLLSEPTRSAGDDMLHRLLNMPSTNGW